jgi:hypothetical protein
VVQVVDGLVEVVVDLVVGLVVGEELAVVGSK